MKFEELDAKLWAAAEADYARGCTAFEKEKAERLAEWGGELPWGQYFVPPDCAEYTYGILRRSAGATIARALGGGARYRKTRHRKVFNDNLPQLLAHLPPDAKVEVDDRGLVRVVGQQ